MIWIVRIGMLGAWVWVLRAAIKAALASDTVATVSAAGYFGMLIFVGIPLAAVWAPVIARMLVGKAIDSVNDDHTASSLNRLALEIDSAVDRGERRKAVFLCWVETWINPKLARPNSIGMTHSVPSSWIELYFARRLFRSSIASECIRAADVMERHGFDPGMHNSDNISLLLLERKKLRKRERLRIRAEKLQAARRAAAEQPDADDVDLEDPPA